MFQLYEGGLTKRQGWQRYRRLAPNARPVQADDEFSPRYAAADGWPGWWGLEGPEYLAWLAEQPEADYTVLMGATTYRLMSRFAAEGEPGTDALAAMSKVVFSATLTEPLSWANTQLVDRFRVVVFPVITGSSGRERIYDGYPDVALDMLSSRTFDGRIQLLEYVPTILAGPPGAGRANA